MLTVSFVSPSSGWPSGSSACFTGKYPIELPPDDQLGKHLLEQAELPLGQPEDGLTKLTVSTGGSTALDHP